MSKNIELRQKLLVNFLQDNFIKGRFFSILEIVRCVRYPDGSPCYNYNMDPYIHDHCAVLSSDVRAINWATDEGCKIIVKDKKGGVKLCESVEEFNTWRNHELEPLEKKWKYLNNLKFKKSLDNQGSIDVDDPEFALSFFDTIKEE